MRMLDVQQIAKRLCLSARSVYRLRTEIPLIRLGPKAGWRAKEDDVLRFQAERLQEID